MKRKAVAVILSVMMAAGLGACGSSSTGSSSTGAASSASAASSAEEKGSTSTSSDAESIIDGSEESVTASGAGSSSASTGEILSTGPAGEKAVDASTIELTDDQISKVKEGNYKAAICLHYGGNDWSTSQQKGLEDTFKDLGIEVVAVTDANFSAEQQVSDIETVMAKKPDVIISIPTDATATSDAYKKASEAGIKLIFMDQPANNMEAGKDYVSVVSADNYGNGYASGTIMAESLGGKGKIGMVFYDADFRPTNQRDEGFRDAIKNYPGIEIATEQGFTDENGCSEQADAILTQYPNINGIYASWDIPLEGVLSSVRAAGKEGQIVLTANDLGNNLAKEIAAGTVAGVGAQMPYDQGVAEAKLAALSLLGEDCPTYVAVPAKKVTHDNVLQAYSDVYHVDAPDWLKDAYKD